MTRAEKRALEAYPPTRTTSKKHAKRVQSERTDTHQPTRAIFQQGYEQAIKDVIALIDSNFLPAFAGKIIRLIEQEYEYSSSLRKTKRMRKEISESRGIIEAIDIVNGSYTLSLRTSVMSYESGHIEDAVIRLPYTGRIDDAKDIFLHSPGLVRIIVETEY